MRQKKSYQQHVFLIAMTLSLMLGNSSSMAQDASLNASPLLEEPFEAFFGARLQRTMTLLESSNQTRRNKVKILFYGQSIVAQGWHQQILKNLKERYPYAIIEAENRAIGGLSQVNPGPLKVNFLNTRGLRQG